MEEGRYFKDALKNLANDMAYAGAVRHLYDNGLSVEEIQKQCTYPVSKSQIEEVIRQYQEEKESGKAGYTFVEETNNVGRRTFKMVKNK